MRSSFASRGGFLLKSPNYRQQAARRRLMVACAVLGLALASGLIGALTAPHDEVATNAATGPFSYFPHQ
jgi:nitrous oxide reductase